MTTSDTLKTTPLHSEHIRLGAKMVGFGGWDMPVQYTGIMAEHQLVRSKLGVFDISHMGQVFVSGAAGEAWLNSLLTNNVEKLAVGECQYSLMLNEKGGVIDDLIVYRLEPDRWLLVINASKIEEDVVWLEAQPADGVVVENASGDYAGIAVQGPNAEAWLAKLLGSIAGVPKRNHIVQTQVNDVSLLIARTGYTGEDGFELFCKAQYAVDVLRNVLETGAEFGILPCGLGARDTLRLEMCYPLNGNDLSADTTPLEAGLGFFVDLSKNFIGSDILRQQKADGLTRRLVAFKMTGKTPPPRSHYEVWVKDSKLGETSSGGLSPSLGTGIGMAYLPIAYVTAGTEIEIDIRGKRYPAVIEKKPLYKTGSTK